VERGATLTARLEKLNALTATYRDKGIDLSRAFKEVEKVKTELAQVSTDYRLTLDFYRKNAAQGADAQEQISLLERMIKKYARAGIDLSEAQKELAKLKGGK
jgi:flagellar biosynthesis chaperone FliJ